jgi:PAS domain S-box-containing protein
LGDFFSKRWLEYTGLTQDEAQGTGWVVAIHPDDLGYLADTWTKIRASGKEGGLEARLRRFDGVYRWFLFRAAPLRDPEGGGLVWYGTNTDIEDLKQAEAELRRREADLRTAQAELAHVTRVTTMGELAASIAHEVSQPIAGVVINANACIRWLSRSKEDPAALAEAHDALHRIIRDGTRAGDVITRIRALFKRTETAKEPLEINAVFEEVIVLSRIEMERRNVVLRTEMAPDLPRVLGDRVQLQQVMINLILNGIEAMSAVEDRPRELVIGTQLHERAQVLATVRDCGVGFDPERIDQLFAAFQTTKSGGLGMGLSISRTIVEDHGGQIWATPNEDAGATFLFTLATDPGAGPPTVAQESDNPQMHRLS